MLFLPFLLPYLLFTIIISLSSLFSLTIAITDCEYFNLLSATPTIPDYNFYLKLLTDAIFGEFLSNTSFSSLAEFFSAGVGGGVSTF